MFVSELSRLNWTVGRFFLTAWIPSSLMKPFRTGSPENGRKINAARVCEGVCQQTGSAIRPSGVGTDAEVTRCHLIVSSPEDLKFSFLVFDAEQKAEGDGLVKTLQLPVGQAMSVWC